MTKHGRCETVKGILISKILLPWQRVKPQYSFLVILRHLRCLEYHKTQHTYHLWQAQASRGARTKWRYEGTIGGGGDYVVPPRLGVSRFTILSRFFVMLVFLFCKLFEHYSQTHFPIIKTKPFKVTKIKKDGRYLGLSG